MKYEIYKEDFDKCKNKGVYLIRNIDNGLLKIGKASDINRRFKEIKRSFKFCGNMPNLNIECYIEYKNNSELEAYFHNTFESNRIQNEWFNIKNHQTVLDSIVKYTEVDNTSSIKHTELRLLDLKNKDTHAISSDYLLDSNFSYKLHIGIFAYGGYENGKCYILRNITRISNLLNISKSTIRNKIKGYFEEIILNKDGNIEYIENIEPINSVIISTNELEIIKILSEMEIRLFIFFKSFSSNEIIGQTQKKILESIGYSSNSKSNEKTLRDSTNKLKELGLIETRLFSDGIKKYIIYYKK